jgi:hypothetical protein
VKNIRRHERGVVSGRLAMFTDLTGQARRVLQLAHQEAFERNHDYLGTEHLLLAMLRAGAADVTRILGTDIDPRRLLDELDAQLVPAPRLLNLERLPMTPAAQRVLDRACQEARKTLHAQAGLEHLLLGVLEEEDSPAALLLNRAGLTADGCQAQLDGKGPAENRDHLVQTQPAAPGSRDPTADELEDRISAEVLPREWRPARGVLPQTTVPALENQLRGTQLVLGGVLGAVAMVELYGWYAVPFGILGGTLVAAFQSSFLGCLFGGIAGFSIGMQYRASGPGLVILVTLVGVFLASWLGHGWRVPPPAPPAPPLDEP